MRCRYVPVTMRTFLRRTRSLTLEARESLSVSKLYLRGRIRTPRNSKSFGAGGRNLAAGAPTTTSLRGGPRGPPLLQPRPHKEQTMTAETKPATDFRKGQKVCLVCLDPKTGLFQAT